MQDTPLLMVEDDETLQRICEQLSQARVIGVDTESDSMFHYREKVCLIQVSDNDNDYIIDPLKIDDMSPLGAIMEATNIVKVFHGADYDVVSLNRDYGWRFRNLFDTMLGAQFLNFPRVGLADLCARFFGAEMDKKYQRHDWSQRPLQPEHLQYARGDSHYLPALREFLVLKLTRAGRLDCVDEECELLQDRQWSGRSGHDPFGWARVKRTGHLEEAELKVLRQLFLLRDRHAQALDRPPYKVFPDRVLVLLAERQPTDLNALKALVRSNSSMVRRYGEEMVTAVRAGVEDSEPLPEPPRERRPTGPRPPHRGREAERFFTQLKSWRSNLMSDRGLPLVMIGNNSQLKAIAGWRPRKPEDLQTLPGLRRWQIARYSEEILEQVARFERGEGAREAARTEGASASGKRRKRRKRRRRKSVSAEGSSSTPAG